MGRSGQRLNCVTLARLTRRRRRRTPGRAGLRGPHQFLPQSMLRRVDQRPGRYGDIWRPWFAWRPVWIDGRRAWRCWVERALIDEYHTGPMWRYRSHRSEVGRRAHNPPRRGQQSNTICTRQPLSKPAAPRVLEVRHGRQNRGRCGNKAEENQSLQSIPVHIFPLFTVRVCTVGAAAHLDWRSGLYRRDTLTVIGREMVFCGARVENPAAIPRTSWVRDRTHKAPPLQDAFECHPSLGDPYSLANQSLYARRRLRCPLDDNYDGRLGFAEAAMINVPPRSRGNIDVRQAGH
jgi:hypothetical protein